MLRKKGSGLLKFDLGLYSPVAIRRSIHDYAAVAEFKTKKLKKNLMAVEIKNIFEDADPAILADEFANYVLAMTKKCL